MVDVDQRPVLVEEDCARVVKATTTPDQ
ncbi:uncharacterized protein METZ01_LOCUS125661 [marine metagenome]|uniref:Uncharacterized protein n=1 Tax=marine metagenome TaxID=408172 RepID=A0A381Y8R0_9ZZZZ